MKSEPIDHLLRANKDLPTTRFPRIPENIEVANDTSEQPSGEPSSSTVDVRQVLSVESDSSFSITQSE